MVFLVVKTGVANGIFWGRFRSAETLCTPMTCSWALETGAKRCSTYVVHLLAPVSSAHEPGMSLRGVRHTRSNTLNNTLKNRIWAAEPLRPPIKC